MRQRARHFVETERNWTASVAHYARPFGRLVPGAVRVHRGGEPAPLRARLPEPAADETRQRLLPVPMVLPLSLKNVNVNVPHAAEVEIKVAQRKSVRA